MTKINQIISDLQSSSTSGLAEFAARDAINRPETSQQDRERLEEALKNRAPPNTWPGSTAQPIPPMPLSDEEN